MRPPRWIDSEGARSAERGGRLGFKPHDLQHELLETLCHSPLTSWSVVASWCCLTQDLMFESCEHRMAADILNFFGTGIPGPSVADLDIF